MIFSHIIDDEGSLSDDFLPTSDPIAMAMKTTFEAVDTALSLVEDDESDCSSVDLLDDALAVGAWAQSERSKSLHKKLRFEDYDDVFEIPHFSDMSDEEYEGCFFSKDEMCEIRSECMSLLQHMEDNSNVEEDICVRGLDHHTEEYTTWRKAIRREMQNAVFDAQDYLRSKGMSAPELIADLCKKFSAESLEAAEIFGMYDAIHANEQASPRL